MRMPERMLYRVMDLAHFTAVRTSARSECEQVLEHVPVVFLRESGPLAADLIAAGEQLHALDDCLWP